MKVENNQQSQPNMSQKMDEMLQQPAQPVAPQSMQPMQPMGGAAKVKKKKNIPAIALGVVAVLGIGAAAYFGVQYFGEKDRADNLAKTNASVQTESTETTSAETGEVASVTVDSSEYIYIGEWGYKIKIPSELKNVSYTYQIYNGTDGSHNEGVRIWGTKGDKMYDFADTYEINVYGVEMDNITRPMGQITREARGVLAKCEASCGTLVFEDGDWEYVYDHPQDVVSSNTADQKAEMAGVELIEQMLSNKENYSKI